QHRRALHGAAAQALQGGVRIGERESLDRRREPQACREWDEGFAVGAGEIGDGSHRALAPQQTVREAGNIAHVDAGADHAAARPHRGERGGNEPTDRGEQDRRIELLRRTLGGGTRPHRAELRREGWPLGLALSSEANPLPALVPRDLRQKVRRGSEAVQAEVHGLSRLPIGAIADEPRAQERRQSRGGDLRWQWQAVTCIRQDLLRVTAVPGVTREARLRAEVLEPRAAVLAHTAGPGEPGDADAIADGVARHVVAARADDSDDLVPGGDGTA